METQLSPQALHLLVAQIKDWAKELGFQQAGISNIDLSQAEARFQLWLDKQMHGEMNYMAAHGTKRSRPEELEPGTLSVISVRMDYSPEFAANAMQQLQSSDKAYVSRYALGRDYHKLIRKRLQQLAKKITLQVEHLNYRVFTDSAPILEKALAEKAGLGWQGKHSNIINSKAGSWFFLGEIYSDLPLPADNTPRIDHCGRCNDCIQACPTDAIVAPYVVDARRCISYLTIELKGAIPEEFRAAIGNRIYGCDDCQLFCPWNKFSSPTQEKDYEARHELDKSDLLELFSWTEAEFLSRLEGNPIRRYISWLRNISIALGNQLREDKNNQTILQALEKYRNHDNPVIKEHILWALAQGVLN